MLAQIQWVNGLTFEALVKQYGDFKALDHRRLCHIAHALLVIALICFFNILFQLACVFKPLAVGIKSSICAQDQSPTETCVLTERRISNTQLVNVRLSS